MGDIFEVRGRQGLTLGEGAVRLRLMPKNVSWAVVAIGLSRAILQVRATRRKLIIYVIVGLLVMFALGNWPLSGWLEDSPVRFLFYWLGCAFVALFLFLLGLYDFLAVIREHKDRMRM